MPPVGPEITQWIRQISSGDQVVAYFAYQSLLETVLHSSAASQAELATALGEALVAQQRQPARAPAAASERRAAVRSPPPRLPGSGTPIANPRSVRI